MTIGVCADGPKPPRIARGRGAVHLGHGNIHRDDVNALRGGAFRSNAAIARHSESMASGGKHLA
ncbi:hypothetical protein AL036_01250 [Salipiger aestuarii]|nr:hypothetical protein AL036_01250 [Salipiger aestuarii]KAB2543323.1 hypothetical protein AL035_02365 [Salipiger aestuarii]